MYIYIHVCTYTNMYDKILSRKWTLYRNWNIIWLCIAPKKFLPRPLASLCFDSYLQSLIHNISNSFLGIINTSLLDLWPLISMATTAILLSVKRKTLQQEQTCLLTSENILQTGMGSRVALTWYFSLNGILDRHRKCKTASLVYERISLFVFSNAIFVTKN